MKGRFAWRWTLRYTDGSTWHGTCPKWAAQPVPPNATLTRERVMAVGKRVPCIFPPCGGMHANV